MFLSIAQQRRSIRNFEHKEVEAEKIDVLIEAALRAPSSRGFNPWRFIVVTDPGLLERLSRARPQGSSFLKNAPLGIVVCADPGKSDVWIEDCSIASIFMLMAAESIGLAGCWIQIRERMHSEDITAEAYVSEVLSIPVEYKVENMVAVGYPAKRLPPHEKGELQYEKIFLNAYGKPY